MAKFFGIVGFAADVIEGEGENEGIAIEAPVIERQYYGDFVQMNRRYENGKDINDDLQLNVRVSILADDYLNEHLRAIKYIDLNGALWKVTNVEPARPRLILSIGGLYNGPTPRSSSCPKKCI